jgi:hypothetical protein
VEHADPGARRDRGRAGLTRPLPLAAAVGGALVGSWLLVGALTGEVALWPPICDDAHYYLQIARHLTDGDGFTFDGINETNGFQPLWLFLLVPVVAVTGGSDTATLAALAVLVLLLTGLAVALAVGLLRRAVAMPAAATAVALLAWPRFLEPLSSGVEAPLALVMALLAAISLATEEEPSWRSGLLLAATFVTRLDATLLLVPLTVLLVLDRTPVRVVARVLVPTAVALGAFAAWSWATFGSPLPISGRLKSSLPELGLWWSSIGQHPDWILLLIASAVVLWTHRARSPVWRVGIVFVTGGLLHLLWTLLAVDWAVENWHFTTYLVGPLVAASLAVDRLLARRPAITWQPAVVVLVANLALSAFVLSQATDFVRSSQDVAAWLDENAEADAVVATRDAGALGYFADHPVINLDGVVNDRHFADEVCAGRLDQYLDDHDVRYLVAIVDDAAVDPGYSELLIPYDCHLGPRRAAASTITVAEADQQFVSEPLGVDRETLGPLPEDDRIVVWERP